MIHIRRAPGETLDARELFAFFFVHDIDGQVRRSKRSRKSPVREASCGLYRTNIRGRRSEPASEYVGSIEGLNDPFSASNRDGIVAPG